jgi:hypothetical protein
MRQFVCFILLLVFNSTNIPVQATGKLLASNQLQEEVLEDAHDLLDSHNVKCPLGGCPFANVDRSDISSILKKLWKIAPCGESIPPNHAHEKLVPPPNTGM